MKSCCDEYCSTHGCNQGRDCPVRKTVATASIVARIGRRDHAPAPLPPSPLQRQLRVGAKWLLTVLALLFYAAVLAALVSRS